MKRSSSASHIGQRPRSSGGGGGRRTMQGTRLSDKLLLPGGKKLKSVPSFSNVSDLVKQTREVEEKYRDLEDESRAQRERFRARERELALEIERLKRRSPGKGPPRDEDSGAEDDEFASAVRVGDPDSDVAHNFRKMHTTIKDALRKNAADRELVMSEANDWKAQVVDLRSELHQQKLRHESILRSWKEKYQTLKGDLERCQADIGSYKLQIRDLRDDNSRLAAECEFRQEEFKSTVHKLMVEKRHTRRLKSSLDEQSRPRSTMSGRTSIIGRRSETSAELLDLDPDFLNKCLDEIQSLVRLLATERQRTRSLRIELQKERASRSSAHVFLNECLDDIKARKAERTRDRSLGPKDRDAVLELFLSKERVVDMIRSAVGSPTGPSPSPSRPGTAPNAAAPPRRRISLERPPDPNSVASASWRRKLELVDEPQ